MSGNRAKSLSGTDGGPLLAWYDNCKRDLPWRNTDDPYAIWVSEVMLQQTQVSTVIPYWRRWMERFPTISALASAEAQEGLSLWQGLGYYRRCRMLMEGAKWVRANGIPMTAMAWQEVPGVGRYTAGAIASIAQGLVAPVVDGNVERVYSRLTGDDSPPKDLHSAAWRWAEHNLFNERPGDWNQALMELGATICTPKEPKCSACPLVDFCVARQSWRIADLPRRPAKSKTIRLHHIAWVPIFGGLWGLRQIPPGQWWEGMWEFPRTGSDSQDEPLELRQVVGEGWPISVGNLKHTVTCHRISIDVYYLICEQQSSELTWFSRDELVGLPMPSPQRKALTLVMANLGIK